jgi:hypothetical protein
LKTKTLTLLAATFLYITLNAQAATNAPVMALENTVVTFPMGGYNLSTEETAKLNKAVTDAKAKGKITKIEIAVWSDKEHPTTGELPKADEKLASERIKAVKHALHKDVSQMKHISAYNMAENSHWLGRYFHSSEADLDAAYSKKGAEELARADYTLIKQDGAPMKAVVIIKVREK